MELGVGSWGGKTDHIYFSLASFKFIFGFKKIPLVGLYSLFVFYPIHLSLIFD